MPGVDVGRIASGVGEGGNDGWHFLGFTSIANARSRESGAVAVVLPGLFLTWVNFVAALLAVFPTAARDVRHDPLVREGACRR